MLGPNSLASISLQRMLKALVTFLSLSLTVLMLVTPTFAREDKSAKAEKTGLSHVKGDVVSVDQNAKTLTVTRAGSATRSSRSRWTTPRFLRTSKRAKPSASAT